MNFTRNILTICCIYIFRSLLFLSAAKSDWGRYTCMIRICQIWLWSMDDKVYIFSSIKGCQRRVKPLPSYAFCPGQGWPSRTSSSHSCGCRAVVRLLKEAAFSSLMFHCCVFVCGQATCLGLEQGGVIRQKRSLQNHPCFTTWSKERNLVTLWGGNFVIIYNV